MCSNAIFDVYAHEKPHESRELQLAVNLLIRLLSNSNNQSELNPDLIKYHNDLTARRLVNLCKHMSITKAGLKFETAAFGEGRVFKVLVPDFSACSKDDRSKIRDLFATK